MQTAYLPQRAFHAAYGLALGELDVVLFESDRAIRVVMQKMLSELGVKKLRAPRSVEDAFWAMRQMQPSLLIVDQHAQPIDGLALVRRMRMAAAGQLAFVPAMLTTSKTTSVLVDMARAGGVNQILIKPFSPHQLTTKLGQLSADSRCFLLKGDRYVIEPAVQSEAG